MQGLLKTASKRVKSPVEFACDELNAAYMALELVTCSFNASTFLNANLPPADYVSLCGYSPVYLVYDRRRRYLVKRKFLPDFAFTMNMHEGDEIVRLNLDSLPPPLKYPLLHEALAIERVKTFIERMENELVVIKAGTETPPGARSLSPEASAAAERSSQEAQPIPGTSAAESFSREQSQLVAPAAESSNQEAQLKPVAPVIASTSNSSQEAQPKPLAPAVGNSNYEAQLIPVAPAVASTSSSSQAAQSKPVAPAAESSSDEQPNSTPTTTESSNESQPSAAAPTVKSPLKKSVSNVVAAAKSPRKRRPSCAAPSTTDSSSEDRLQVSKSPIKKQLRSPVVAPAPSCSSTQPSEVASAQPGTSSGSRAAAEDERSSALTVNEVCSELHTVLLAFEHVCCYRNAFAFFNHLERGFQAGLYGYQAFYLVYNKQKRCLIKRQRLPDVAFVSEIENDDEMMRLDARAESADRKYKMLGDALHHERMSFNPRAIEVHSLMVAEAED